MWLTDADKTKLNQSSWSAEVIEEIVKPYRGRYMDRGNFWGLEAILASKQLEQTIKLEQAITECRRLQIWDADIKEKFLQAAGIAPGEWHLQTQQIESWMLGESSGINHATNPGALIIASEEPSPHWFGGDDFQLPASHGQCQRPIRQFFLLDIRAIEPLALLLPNWSQFPVIGCIDCCLQLFRHDYQIHQFEQKATLTNIAILEKDVPIFSKNHGKSLDPAFPKQFAKLQWISPLELEQLTNDELDDIQFDKRVTFFGWKVSLAAGRPEWIQSPEMIYCRTCRAEMVHVVSVGSEIPHFHPSFIVNNGSGYHYHFACNNCHTISVIGQNT